MLIISGNDWLCAWCLVSCAGWWRGSKTTIKPLLGQVQLQPEHLA